MLNKLEMETIWNTKPVGYLRANYFSRKKLKKYLITYKRELVKRKRIDDATLVVYATSVRNTDTPDHRKFRADLYDSTKAMTETEGYDSYTIYDTVKEIT